MVEAAEILRRRLPQLLRELVHRKAGRVGGADSLLHEVQIEGGVFPVREQRIPDLVAPSEKSIRLGGIGL